MELRQLRYVEAVDRHRHFTRAAEELHVAQSALSHQIRRLEAELGTELFERTGLIRGRISIGALLPGGELDVPQLLGRFTEAHPGIEVDLHEGTAGDMLRYLVEDEVHAAFALLAGPVPDELVAERLSEDELVAVF